MPMMRRGPLERYPTESVLRQASVHQLTGGLEFHSQAPATFYFNGGRIYAASAGVDLGAEGPEIGPTDEVTARREAVALLATSLNATDGWYYHDPLTRHRSLGEWHWDVASLIMESRSHRPPAREAAPVAPTAAASGAPAAPPPAPDRPVQLTDAAGSTVALGPDAWSVVVALAATGTADALAEQMGWDRGRIDAAVSQLEGQGVLAADGGGDGDELPGPTALTTPASAPAGNGKGSHVGPLTPPSSIDPEPTSGPGRRRRRR